MKESINILVLDYDGCLNSANWFRNRVEREKTNQLSYDENQIDPEAVKHLNSILEKTDCKVIVSSVWRRSRPIGQLVALLISRGLDKKFYRHFIGTTPILNAERGLEIQKWLDDNKKYLIKNIVICDDDSDMLHLMPYLVQCDCNEGLTEERANEMIKRLTA